MASTKLELSSRKNNLGESEVIIRVTVRRGLQPRLHTGLFIKPERLKAGRISFPRLRDKEYDRLLEIDSKISEIQRAVIDAVGANSKTITKEDLQRIVDDCVSFKEPDKKGFYDLWSEFLESRKLSEHRISLYHSVIRTLHRFEIYKQLTNKDFRLDLSTIDKNTLSDYIDFLRVEHTLPERVTKHFAEYPPELRMNRKRHYTVARGDNAISDILKKISAFFNWCRRNGYTDNQPFENFEKRPKETYGKPFYLTIEERDIIAQYDLSFRPALAVQRDIFIFQCLTGCRVGDLLTFTPDNIVDGALEYVADKTINDRPAAIRVPLNPQALEIVERYKGNTKLLPFISPQRYNDAIKAICKICGIDRVVTIINPTTGKDERRPIYEIASSHMARRTFIGNLYKRVKDQNLVGALSGHVEGSRAFARYRDIDDDIRREVIGLLQKDS